MDLRHVTTENWAELETKYKDAHYFLGRCALLNEHKKLVDFAANSEYTLNDYDTKRLTELNRWYNDMVLIGELAELETV